MPPSTNHSSPITIVVAAADNNVIGINNEMPWHIPEDFKHFKTITMGKPCIMGRKTFESIVAQLGKPLPGRLNVIITRQNDYTPLPNAEGVLPSPLGEGGGLGWGANLATFPGLIEAIQTLRRDHEEIMIVGGAQIYAQALEQKLVDRIYLTRVHQSPQGDAFFPALDMTEWIETAREDRDGFSFLTLNRK